MSAFEVQRKLSKINKPELKAHIWTSDAYYKKISDYWGKVWNNDLKVNPKKEEFSKYDTMSYNIKFTQKWRSMPDPEFNFLDVDMMIEQGQIIGVVGMVMGLTAINLMCTDEQMALWKKPAEDGDYILAYAQTELGHGSDVQSLKTTATYDQTLGQFVINTPDIEAYKYWPGDLGVCANFVILYAQVITQGKNCGVFPLMVQIRDLKTHKLLPGIDAGDIGPKLGYKHKDNGFLSFSNVKVPRNALLGKYVSVEPNGKFLTRGNLKIMYASMMHVRETILSGSAKSLIIGATIALRYSIVRTQFKGTDGIERPIIDYQLQKSKIFPLIAKGYAMHFTTLRIKEIIRQNLYQVQTSKNFDLMKEVHILLANGKAMYSQWSNDGLITLMQACGGHGYLISSGIGSMLHGSFPNVILEGENTVMLLQVSKELLKSYHLLQNGEGDKLAKSLRYLKNFDKLIAYKMPTDLRKEAFRDINMYYTIFSKMICAYILKSGIAMFDGLKKGKKHVVEEQIGVKIVDAAKLNGVLFTIGLFERSFRKMNEGPIKSALSKLSLLFAIDQLHAYAHIALETKSVSFECIDFTKEIFEELLEELTPDALVLVEAFDFPDLILNSTIGHSNGKPYENLYNWAKENGSLNQFDVHPTMLEYIKAQEVERKKKGIPEPKL